MSGNIRIEEVRELSSELVPAVGRRVAQLSSRSPAPDAAELQAIIESSATRLLLARGLDGVILGTLTLATYRIPTGVCAWIEDVVVDERARGRGIGQELTKAALQLADEHGADVVDLTSPPSREAANRLYRRRWLRRRRCGSLIHPYRQGRRSRSSRGRCARQQLAMPIPGCKRSAC